MREIFFFESPHYFSTISILLAAELKKKGLCIVCSWGCFIFAFDEAAVAVV